MLTVSGILVTVIEEWLQTRGYRASSLIRAIRHIRPDQSVDIPTVDGFLQAASTISGEPLAPLMIGQGIGRQHLGAMGHMLESVHTLEDMLNAYVFYERLFYGANIANVHRNKQGMALSWRGGSVPRHYACFAMSSFVAMTRQLGVRDSAVACVSFPFNDSEHQQYYCHAMGVDDVIFGKPLGLSFYREALQRQLLTGGNSPRIELLQALFPELSDLDFAEQLYEEVIAALPHKQATLAHMASQLMVSERTLQRRLHATQDGLRGAVNRIRMDLACRYLQDKGMSLVAISLLLGYSEQSAFQAAFKRHYGLSPGVWRKQ